MNTALSTMDNSTTDRVPTEMDVTECCSKCRSEESSEFTRIDLAITACVSFIAGIAIVLLILFIITLKRDKKMCFKKKEEPFKGKFEGASKKATLQVLKKHTLERSPEKCLDDNIDHSEEETIKEHRTSVEIAVLNTETESHAAEEVTKQENVKATITNEDNEKVDRDLEATSVEIKQNVPVEGPEEVNEHATIVEGNASEGDLLKRNDRLAVSSHLFEKSRGSSVYEHDDLVLQNANFRISAMSNI